MPSKKVDSIKKRLREAELDGIASSELLDDIDVIEEATIETIASNRDYLAPLIRNGIPFLNSQQFVHTKYGASSNISIDDFLSLEEIRLIEKNLNRPLVERSKWDRWDYATAFTVALAGAVIDTLVGNPRKGLSAICSDKDSFIGKWLEGIHRRHSNNNPMDYQGFKMGGGGHRLRSIGHDLLGFPFGIWQIMNGTFTGGYYQDGKYHDILSKATQYGCPYESKDFAEALWTYTAHVFCDFFSTYSLPVPGFGYLTKMPVREIRVFASEMYDSGYNLRHVMMQSFSALFIEITIRTYSHFRFKKGQGLENEQLSQKRRELLLLSHSIAAGFNVGKVAITGNLLALNLSQIFAVVFHFIPFVMFHYRNNNTTQKLLRNIGDLKENHLLLESEMVRYMKESKVFNGFLMSQPIILNL